MASKYRKKFELPEGFYEILEEYSKEVLRDQPLDIVEFSYLYFKALEEVSQSTKHLALKIRTKKDLPDSKSTVSLCPNEPTLTCLVLSLGNHRSV